MTVHEIAPASRQRPGAWHGGISSMQDQPNVPYGFCQCGCGERTRIARQTRSDSGQVRGEPMRFIHNHHTRGVSRGPFWLVDADSGCWIWQKTRFPSGYGMHRVSVAGVVTTQNAHRWVYQKLVGPIPEGLVIDHLCRNRICVNPDHLEPVTFTENVRRGNATKLTAADVAAIRGAVPSYGYLIRLAEQYGISWDTVRHLRAGQHWTDVEAA